MNPSFFRDKVVVITGSARGIGRETARQALSLGALVVLNGRDASKLEATRAALGQPERCLAVAADVSNPEEAEALVATVLAKWKRIDVLINNAGSSMRAPFSDLSVTTVRAMIDSNLLSAVWTTRSAMASLREAGGHIVFVSSLAGVRGFPGVSLYSASKMALAALAESVRAEEAGKGVTVGLVLLPFTENDREKTVLNAEGHSFQHERRWTLSQAGAARAILASVAGGRSRTVPSVTGRLLVWAQRWFPGLVDQFVVHSGGTLHRVEEKQP